MLADIAAHALAAGRQAAADLMSDRCTVYRVDGVPAGTLGDTDLTYTRLYPAAPDADPHAGGPAKRKAGQNATLVVEAVGHSTPLDRADAHFPLGAFTPRVGDLIVWVGTAHDPGIPGRVDRVTSDPAKTYRTAMRLSVEEMPENRLTTPEALAAYVDRLEG